MALSYRPINLNAPAAQKTYNLTLDNFKGVDFANNPLNVKPYRSPDLLNMIPDMAGFPVSRTGYTLYKDFSAATENVNGMYKLGSAVIIHHGTKLTKLGTPDVDVYSDMNDKRSRGFYYDSKLYILDGKTYLVYDGSTCVTVASVATIPITSIGRSADGTTTTAYEDINLISAKRKNQFSSSTGSGYYFLDATSLDHTAYDSGLVTVEVLNDSGSWVALTRVAADPSGGPTQDSFYMPDAYADAGKFWLTPLSFSLTTTAGVDNIRVLFQKTITANENKINKCDIAIAYGYNGAANRIFVSGNPDTPNLDWHSEIDDPTYFSDLSYAEIGQDRSAIIGYSRMNDGTLAIHKGKLLGEPSIFYRESALLSGDEVFPLKLGAEGVGVVSKYAFANLLNDPLMLSEQGVFATVPVTNSVTNEKYAQERSFFVNKNLTAEATLSEAIAIEFNGFYLLGVNGNVYIADSRQKTYIEKGMQGNEFQYEWYFWNNIPARIFFEDAGVLYFGTATGKVYQFPIGDNAVYQDAGTDIEAYWATPILNLGSFTNYKTILNSYVIPAPYIHAEVNIDYVIRSLAVTMQTVKNELTSIFDWDDIDFDAFTFETDTFPRIVSSGAKAKKIMLIQFRFWSEAGTPFGIYAFSANYQMGGRLKN